MRQYYFVASLLPPLEIGHVPTLGFPALRALLEENLSPSDLRQVHDFLRLVDMENVRALWAGEPLEERGNLSKASLQEAISQRQWSDEESFPPYFNSYLDKYPSINERLEHFAWLMASYLQEEATRHAGFLGEFFAFQREMILVLVGFRAKKLGRDVGVELQFEDPTDPLVAHILAQKDSKSYEPPFEYVDLRPVFEEFEDAPLALHKALCQYQFDRLVEMGGNEQFTVDRILNYMARLLLVERWLTLDTQTGIQVIDTIEKGIR